MALADTARLISSLELQDKFSATADKYERAIGGMERDTSRLGRIGSEVGRGIQNTARNVTFIAAAGAAALTGLVVKSVEDASKLQQAGGAVDSVFGKARDTLDEFAATSAQAAGLAKREVFEMGAVIGAQLQGMGFNADKAAEKTVQLEKRAADLAATFGGSTREAIEAIASLMRGERDPIEKYGVSLKQVDINAELAARGLDNLEGKEKKLAEATVALDLLMQQTAKTEGQFARESGSLAGVQARLGASFEDMRASLGTALLPKIAEVGERINSAIASHMPEIEAFAAELPGIFDDLVGVLEGLPWGPIGEAFKLMGTGAKAALDLFTGLPPWVQTAVLTGWGLNKLTGGALGNIVGELGKGLVKGILNMNAAVVNVNGKVVNGPGGGVPTGGRGGGFGGGFVGGLVATAGVGLAATAGVMTVDFVGKGREQLASIDRSLHNLDRDTVPELYKSLDKVKDATDAANDGIVASIISTKTGLNARLDQEGNEIRGQIHVLNASEGRRSSELLTATRSQHAQRLAAVHQLNANEGTRAAQAQARLEAIRGTQASSNVTLAQIRDKRSSVNVTVNTATHVTLAASEVALRVQQLTQTTTGPRIE